MVGANVFVVRGHRYHAKGVKTIKKTVVLLFVFVLIMVLAAPAGATPPSGVHIEVESSTVGDPPPPGPFVASGPAVDDGLICDTGTVFDTVGKVTGFSQNGFNFQGIKHFICDDGSGEFYVNLQARIDYTKGVTFNWNVISGTGAYEDLHGAGHGVGIPGVPCGDPYECVLDLYDGGLHID